MRQAEVDIERAYRLVRWAVPALLAAMMAVAVAGMLASCSSLWASTKSAAAPAGGAAAGALVGSAVGPWGTIGGAALGAAAADSLEENASLRSGETIGEGALDNELSRWKGRAGAATNAFTAAQAANEWLWTCIRWAVVALGAWWLWRNRANFRDLGFWRGLAHSCLGGEVGKPK